MNLSDFHLSSVGEAQLQPEWKQLLDFQFSQECYTRIHYSFITASTQYVNINLQTLN